MVYSAEIRWFFKNKFEVELIEKWFNSQSQVFADKWDRADIYLWQPGLDKVGIKIREGKVEVKVLLADRGEVPFSNHNAGLVNDWVKYSFGLQESDAENQNLLHQFSAGKLNTDKPLWVRVDKERLLLKFSVNPADKSVQRVPENTWPPEGCGVELTRIKVNQQTFYTFGLEAFSNTQLERCNLEVTLERIMPDMPVSGLRRQQSYSYPGFLQELFAAL